MKWLEVRGGRIPMGDFTQYYPCPVCKYASPHQPCHHVLTSLIGEDDAAVLLNLGLPLNAGSVEVARALLHAVVDDYRARGSETVDSVVSGAVERLRARDRA